MYYIQQTWKGSEQVNGKWVTTERTSYFEKFELNTGQSGATNTFISCWQDKKKALKIFDKEEAERMATFLHGDGKSAISTKVVGRKPNNF